MATEIVQVRSRADRPVMTPADLAAHVAASHVRPTAPLPAGAAEALARLERAFAPVHDTHSYSRMTPEVRRAVIRFEIASERTAELSHLMDQRTLTVAEFDVLEHAQDVMAGARAVLADAGMLHLIGGA